MAASKRSWLARECRSQASPPLLFGGLGVRPFPLFRSPPFRKGNGAPGGASGFARPALAEPCDRPHRRLVRPPPPLVWGRRLPALHRRSRAFARSRPRKAESHTSPASVLSAGSALERLMSAPFRQAK